MLVVVAVVDGVIVVAVVADVDAAVVPAVVAVAGCWLCVLSLRVLVDQTINIINNDEYKHLHGSNVR